MMGLVDDCCLLSGFDDNFIEFKTKSPPFIIEWTREVIKCLIDKNCCWTINVMTSFGICIAHKLKADKRILLDLSFGNVPKLPPFRGDREKIGKVVAFSYSDNHWSLMVIDKEKMEIDEIHNLDSDFEEDFYYHAIQILQAMGWGSESTIEICENQNMRKRVRRKKKNVFYYCKILASDGGDKRSCGPVACSYLLQLVEGGELIDPSTVREKCVYQLVKYIIEMDSRNEIRCEDDLSLDNKRIWKEEFELKMNYAVGLYQQQYSIFLMKIMEESDRCVVCERKIPNEESIASLRCHCIMDLRCLTKVVINKEVCACSFALGEEGYILDVRGRPLSSFKLTQDREKWISLLTSLTPSARLITAEYFPVGVSEIESNLNCQEIHGVTECELKSTILENILEKKKGDRKSVV